MIAKYRAKRIDNNQWVYGMPLYYNGRCWIANGFRLSYYDEDSLNAHLSMNQFEVDPKTAVQWTGKKDKNGKDVYEGDVFDVADRYVEVYWNEHLAMWDTKFKALNGKGGKWFVGGLKSCDWEQYAEVVGNIYDEELLK